MSARGRRGYGDLADEIKDRARRAQRYYVSNGKRTWPEDAVERRDPSSYRRPSIVPVKHSLGGEFLPEGSRERRRCLACDGPLP